MFKIWRWRGMENYYKESRRKKNSLPTIKRRKANWIGHILRRNCLLKHVTEGKVKEMTGRRKRRRKRLLDDTEEKNKH
jgi:hypothetical protein